MASWGGGRCWLESGLGVGGVREGRGGDASLNVAAVEGVALKVPIDILHAWQLHSVLVHAPADATFAATGRLALGWGEQQAVRMVVPRCPFPGVGGSAPAWPLFWPCSLSSPSQPSGFWYAPRTGDGPRGNAHLDSLPVASSYNLSVPIQGLQLGILHRAT